MTRSGGSVASSPIWCTSCHSARPLRWVFSQSGYGWPRWSHAGSDVRMVAGDYNRDTLGRLISSGPYFKAAEAFRYSPSSRAKGALLCCATRQQAHNPCFGTDALDEAEGVETLALGQSPFPLQETAGDLRPEVGALSVESTPAGRRRWSWQPHEPRRGSFSWYPIRQPRGVQSARAFAWRRLPGRRRRLIGQGTGAPSGRPGGRTVLPRNRTHRRTRSTRPTTSARSREPWPCPPSA